MTTVSDAIDRLMSYDWDDWMVTRGEMRTAITLFRSDTTIDATIDDLKASGGLMRLLMRVNKAGILRELIAVLAAKVRKSAATLRKAIETAQSVNVAFRDHGSWSSFPGTPFFDVCHDLQVKASGMGFSKRAPGGVVGGAVISGASGPFSGVGATGTNPSTLEIGLVDQAMMAAGDKATLARYKNPLPGSLSAYLKGLTPAERVHQAETLIRQPISSLFPHSYLGRLPRRSQVMHAAGKVHDLEPQMIAAIILAEQRDQSKNEDSADFRGALSVLKKNTSIGLGQIVVTTARRNDIFQDLLTGSVRGALTREQIIHLLASDEFNIFGTARYIRLVANMAAKIPIGKLPATKAAFPGIDMAKFALHSSNWPHDNVQALAAEYTSTPWDDVVTGWGWFVGEGFKTIHKSGITFP